MKVLSPQMSVDHLDRIDECEAALKAEFQGLTEAALEAGWDRYEVAVALANLGDRLVDETARTAGSQADIAIAKALFEIKRAFS
jgi:hypothetical protein